MASDARGTMAAYFGCRVVGRSAWAACVVSSAMAAGLLWATGTGLEVGTALLAAGSVLALVAVSIGYTMYRPRPRVAAVAGGLATVMWGGYAAGVTALAALRTGMPLIDAPLARADAALGFNTSLLVSWVSRHNLIGQLLEVAYLSTVPLVFSMVLLLALLGRDAAMWGLCFSFSSLSAFSAAVSSVFPAIGAFAYYQIGRITRDGLPDGVGDFHLPVFEAYRSGALDTIDVSHLAGVVTFPSFHAAMALMIAHAACTVRWLAGPMLMWSGLIMVSAIPIGGHYAIDLVVGGVVWAFFSASTSSWLRRSGGVRRVRV